MNVQVLTIKCIFDEESGRSGMDPLGKLVVSDGHSSIVIEPTFLDSWLAALIDALPRLRTTNHVSVEAPEEPNTLQIDVTFDGHLAMLYKDQKVSAEGARDLELALRAAVGAFLNELKNCAEASQNRDLVPLRRFSVTTQN
jgi:hypothetical protein